MIKNAASDKKAVFRRAKRKVFIVDDHPIVRQGVTDLINREKDLLTCGESGSITNAIPIIRKNNPDIVIMDISMGSSNGLKHIEEFCHQFTDLSVLILSYHDEAIYAERCLRAGTKGYIMKMEPPDELLNAIRVVLDNEIYISSRLGPALIKKLVSKSTGVNSSSLEQLSNRELEVFQFIGQGMKTRVIAENLNLSVKTIETYIAHIKKKMDFKSSRELFLYAVQWSITEHKF